MPAGLTFQQLLWGAAAAFALATLSLLRAWALRHRREGASPGLLRRCAGLLLGQPKAAGLLLLAALAMPVPVALVAVAAFGLSSYPGGIFAFLPLATAGAAASLLMGGSAGAASVCFVAAWLRGERRALADGVAAGGRWLAAGLRWALSLTRRSKAVPYNHFIFPIMITERADFKTASRRAEEFLSQAPQAVDTVQPLHRSLTTTALWISALFLPLSIGFFCLPALSFMGYSISTLPVGFSLYAGLWALFALALCAGLAAAAFQFTCAMTHAACVFIYATGAATARQRVLQTLPMALVWPEDDGLPMGQACAPPSPEPKEYPRETLFPQAGHAHPPKPASERAFVPPSAMYAPELDVPVPKSRRAPVYARALYRLAALASLAGLVVYMLFAFDAQAVAERYKIERDGTAAYAVVMDVEASPTVGTLVYRVTFEFEAEGRKIRDAVFAGEAVRGRLARGQRVPIHYMPGEPSAAALDEDFGFARNRVALMLLLAVLLSVGGLTLVRR